MDKLKFKQEIVCGRLTTYPDCESSILIQKLLGKQTRGKPKTFTKDHLQILEKLGYKIILSSMEPKITRYKRVALKDETDFLDKCHNAYLEDL